MKKIIFYFLLIVVLSSCFKEDDPYPAFDMQTSTIEMGQYYLHQVYFDLVTNEIVGSNEKNDWDLGFESGDSSWHIILNTASFSLAANTGINDFDLVNDTTGLDWRFDKSDGNPDSTAIGQWFAIEGMDTLYLNHVYVIDRGFDHLGMLRGIKKIVFTRVDSLAYAFRYADLNGENEKEFEMMKSEGAYYSYFSFEEDGKKIDLEPRTDSWDLLFTQYTTLLYTDEGEPYPYLVTGVLSNFGQVEMALDTLKDYASVDFEYARSLSYTINKDFIGYDWKELIGDVNSGNVYYEIVEGNNYIIKTGEGLYFKLRFINFYSEEGEKGYPSFMYDIL